MTANRYVMHLLRILLKTALPFSARMQQAPASGH